MAIFISAFIAVRAIKANRIAATEANKTSIDIAKKKNAIDLLVRIQSDETLHKSIKSIRKIHHDKDIEISKFAYDERAEEAEAISLRYVLNTYETISVGVKHSIYDEQSIQDSWHSNMVSVWNQAHSYVEKRRELNTKTLYIEFEALAKRWLATPLTSDEEE